MDEEYVPGIAELVWQSVHNLGFTLPRQPPPEPEMPRDITAIPQSELVGLMDYYASMIAWGEAQVASAGLDTAVARAKHARERAIKYLSFKEDRQSASVRKIPVKDIEYVLDSDDELDELKGDEVIAEQRQSIIKAILKGYEARHFVLSRELTRRSGPSSRDF